MPDRKLTISADRLVFEANDAVPAFTDNDGHRINGLYGACYKLKEQILSGNYDTADISFTSDEEYSDSLRWQIDSFKKILEETAIGTGEEISLNQDQAAALAGILDKLSPSGRAVSVPKFTFSLTITSDLQKVEEIFRDAHKYAEEQAGRYAGFFFIADKALEGGRKRRPPLGLAFTYDLENVYYIPLINFMTEDYLGKKLEELSGVVSLTTFDIKESYRYFEPLEISERTRGYDESDRSYLDKPRCFDVLIGAYLCNPLKNDYEPWDISQEYLGIPMQKRSDIFEKKLFSESDESVVADYAAKVAYLCCASAPLIRKKLSKYEMENLFYNIEMPLSYILYAMEKEGIIAKREALKEYGDRLSGRIGELENAIYEAAGQSFNINSPKQLGEILFEKLGLPAEKKTKSGYSTAADVLEKLAPEHTIVADILEYRGLAKLKSTYADGLLSFIEDDDRIHTSFNQTITATGRISSTEPNLQNIPMRTELGRLIRKVFVPKEGYVFSDADYSQIELRILAHMSEDEGLIAAYHEGDDIHAITASKVFHVPFDEVTPLQRRNAKAVNFGIVYGISSFGLSQDLSISVGEAKEYMDKYFETYPGVRNYQNRVIQDAKNKGYSITMFGRRRPIPELRASNFNIKQFGERVAMNAPIQGSAADIMKIAMIDVFFRLKKEERKSRLILQIHDELVIETAPDEISIVGDILKQEMENAVKLSVPMEVDCHTGSDWYEAK